jgi:CxxC-x17-CxxC domain-containing protein
MSFEDPYLQFSDKSMTCVDCGDTFIWTGGAQQFFHAKGLEHPPKRCPPCKEAKRECERMTAEAHRAGEQIRVEVTCTNCGEPTVVPFYPTGRRPVYCRPCMPSRV